RDPAPPHPFHRHRQFHPASGQAQRLGRARRRGLRPLGYLIHTNRELGLMLRGKKPLAYFSDFVDESERFTDLVTRYLRMFDRHVEAGRFVKREHRERIDASGGKTFNVLRIFYALPDEAWRIDAMIELLENHRCNGNEPWTGAQERQFGMLL